MVSGSECESNTVLGGSGIELPVGDYSDNIGERRLITTIQQGIDNYRVALISAAILSPPEERSM